MINPAFTAMTGYECDEAIGRTPRILKSGHHGPALYEDLWTTVRAGRIWRHEMVNRRKDGSLYDEDQTITPVFDEHGAVAHFVAIKQDVTERLRAVEALRRSEEHFRSLIENTLDMIFVMDTSGILRYASPSVERVIGYRPRSWWAVGLRTHAPRRHRHHPGRACRRQGRSELHRVGRVSDESQGRLVADDRGGRAQSHRGARHRRIVINARDITNARAFRTEPDREAGGHGQPAAGVAHELKQPLSIVIGHATCCSAPPPEGDGGARDQDR